MTRRKVRRVKRPTDPAPEAVDRDVETVSRAVGSVPNASLRKREVSEEALREEYAYVLLDLRRMFIIAAAMFILLIVLGLLL